MKVIKKENNKIISDLSFDEIIDAFLSFYDNRHTQKAYLNDIQSFIVYEGLVYYSDIFNKYVSFSSFSQSVINYIEVKKLQNKEDGRRLMNSSSIRRMIYSLKRFFSYLVHYHNLKKNPLEFYKTPAKRAESNTEILNSEELEQLFNFLDAEKARQNNSFISERNYLYIKMLYAYMPRVNEINHLLLSDINMIAHEITFHQKGNKVNTFNIPKSLQVLLYPFINKYCENKSYLFFPSRNRSTVEAENKAISSRAMQYEIKNICKQLFPDKKITPHSFRASHTSNALAAGRDPITILNTGNWHSLDMVNYYNRNKSKEYKSVLL